jgi:Lipid A 3-O-deacylase (PagL)
MRRLFLPSHCVKDRYEGEKLVRASRITIALFALLASTIPLRAQTDPHSFSSLPGSDSNADCLNNHDSGACDPEPEPILRAGNRVNSAHNAPAEALPVDSSIGFEEVSADSASSNALFGSAQSVPIPKAPQAVQGTNADAPHDVSQPSAGLVAQKHGRPDRNLDIYYRNRREFSLDVGWHPVNIPFVYEFLFGDNYIMTPLKYTLMPIVASLRWHVTGVGWRGFFRGNMDFTFSGSVTAIPRGPETHYYSFDFGIRRNFVYRNWKIVPFFEQRGGAGLINAKEPLGVQFAQGQNLTFTYNMGAGARYNINSKYSFSAGMNYMHISNAYLSEPQFDNYGINVYGPMFGLDIRLGKPHHSSPQ